MRAIGMMSGTSMDGIDVAMIESDGTKITRRYRGHTFPYSAELRQVIEQVLEDAPHVKNWSARPEAIAQAEQQITQAYSAALNAYIENYCANNRPDLIGAHGQTILHRPDDALTIQLLNGRSLARSSGIDVVYDFRQADMAAGGQGAPLAPLYHQALAHLGKVELPAVFVNIGGISNISWIGPGGELIAFDTGPGNNLLDDWVARCTSQKMDADGAFARQGQVDDAALQALLNHGFFTLPAPKSLDRKDFTLDQVHHLSLTDGAATLSAFTAHALKAALAHMPAAPKQWIICGGGAQNPHLMDLLGALLPGTVRSADALGFDADFIEAEAFAYFAIRSTLDLPLSLPGTTGVAKPMSGGKLARAISRAK